MGLFGPSKEEVALSNQIKTLKEQLSLIERKKADEMIKIYEQYLIEKRKTFSWLSGCVADLLEIAKEQYWRNSYSNKYDYSKLNHLLDKQNLVKQNMELKYELKYLKSLPMEEAKEIVKQEEIEKRQKELNRLRKEYDLLWLKSSETEKEIKSKERKIEKTKDTLKEIIVEKQKQELIEENKMLKGKINNLIELIPENEELIESDELLLARNQEEYLPNKYLSKDEYNQLSDLEKNKKALEYWFNKNKSKWSIGKDFERYIGYKYEQKGFKVKYYGIEKKLEDLGRDLIVENDDSIIIIQCKYWGKDKYGNLKLIREKHIMQLFGTTYKYKLENPNVNKNIYGLFITHSELSETAHKFAKELGIEVVEHANLERYPVIKCNVGSSGEKIYHLPMDQQYDSTKIDTNKGEFYAFTIEEAETKGFRRAYKWSEWHNLWQ
jgi:hypothetical protein